MSARQVDSIQLLRAIAAISVVVNHSILAIGEGVPNLKSLSDYSGVIGRFGVDVFFVISGFIMVYTSKDNFLRPGASWSFLKKRIARIVPLYWVITTYHVIKSALIGKHLGALFIVCSYMFIPFPNELGYMSPVLGVGWSLNSEMLFYVLFAVALLCGRWSGVACLAAFLTFVVFGHYESSVFAQYGSNEFRAQSALSMALYFWSRPIMLYFVIGTFIGLSRTIMEERNIAFTLRSAILLSLIVIVLVAVYAEPLVLPSKPIFAHSEDFDTPLMAIGAIVIVAVCALSGDYGSENGAWRTFRSLGNYLGAASYSIYLSHGVFLGSLAKIYRASFAGLGIPLFILVSSTICTVMGALVFRFVETPLLSFFRGKLVGTRRRPALGGGPA